MKLNRRNVLVAATAFAAGYGPPNTQTAAAEKRSPNTNQIFADATNVAATAAECAAACHESLDACTARLSFGAERLKELMAAIRDCSDICAVTATVLARHGTMAPALCQACADACQRMIAAGRDFAEIHAIQQGRAAAARCAVACRSCIA